MCTLVARNRETKTIKTVLVIFTLISAVATLEKKIDESELKLNEIVTSRIQKWREFPATQQWINKNQAENREYFVKNEKQELDPVNNTGIRDKSFFGNGEPVLDTVNNIQITEHRDKILKHLSRDVPYLLNSNIDSGDRNGVALDVLSRPEGPVKNAENEPPVHNDQKVKKNTNHNSARKTPETKTDNNNSKKKKKTAIRLDVIKNDNYRSNKLYSKHSDVDFESDSKAGMKEEVEDDFVTTEAGNFATEKSSASRAYTSDLEGAPCTSNADCELVNFDIAESYNSTLVKPPFCANGSIHQQGSCTCGADYCVSYSMRESDGIIFYFCGPCSRIGSQCNENISCTNRLSDCEAGYCQCDGGEYYDLYYCIFPYNGYEKALQIAIATCIFVAACLLAASIYGNLVRRGRIHPYLLRMLMRRDMGTMESPAGDTPPKYDDVIAEDALPSYQQALELERQQSEEGENNPAFEGEEDDNNGNRSSNSNSNNNGNSGNGNSNSNSNNNNGNSNNGDNNGNSNDGTNDSSNSNRNNGDNNNNNNSNKSSNDNEDINISRITINDRENINIEHNIENERKTFNSSNIKSSNRSNSSSSNNSSGNKRTYNSNSSSSDNNNNDSIDSNKNNNTNHNNNGGNNISSNNRSHNNSSNNDNYNNSNLNNSNMRDNNSSSISSSSSSSNDTNACRKYTGAIPKIRKSLNRSQQQSQDLEEMQVRQHQQEERTNRKRYQYKSRNISSSDSSDSEIGRVPKSEYSSELRNNSMNSKRRAVESSKPDAAAYDNITYL